MKIVARFQTVKRRTRKEQKPAAALGSFGEVVLSRSDHSAIDSHSPEYGENRGMVILIQM